MSGLPPHIAQVIAGHRDINVTMGYKAVYPDEAIQSHLAFLSRRRAMRPTDEYRVPTDAEWQEFLGHFERRKVSTGICGRAVGTPCVHEHSCLRCSMHWPDPAQRQRIAEIRDNLSPASPKPNAKAGSAKSKDSRSASPGLTTNSPKSTGGRPQPLSTSACPTHNTRKPHGRNAILSSEKPTFPAHGCTTRAIFAPRSSDSDSDTRLQRRPQRSPTGNARPTTRCYDVSRSRPPESGIWKQRTNSSAMRSRWL